VYVKVLSGQARYQGRAAFKTWIFSVIRNTALDERRRRRLRWLFPFTDGVAEGERPDPAADQAARLEQSQAAAVFQGAFARLPGRQQEVMHLVFYQDLSIQEAAEVMGVSLGSARTHYERGKQRLRAWLSDGEEAHGRG
jgi:RNA polymerase sigma-70 factor (ECF subfamily)